MNSKLIATGILALMLCTVFVAVPADADGTGFDITDGEGRTYHYDSPAERIVSTGAATTLTIAEAGAVNKIVAVDRYSTYDYTGYDELEAMDAVDLGSFYGKTNHDYIVTTLINMVDDGELSLDDTIILTSYTSNRALYERLDDTGFTKVLVWTTDSVSDYDAIVQMVSDVSMIASGTVPGSVSSMLDKTAQVSDAVSEVTERAKALFVWYTGGEFSVGNSSIMNSMLEVANADNIGYSDSTASHYGDVNTVISLLEANPGTVIFVNYSYGTAGGTAESFREDVLGGNTDYPVVIMDSLWNNWCPESADGLMTIGQYLYPDLLGEPYDGYIEDYGPGSGSGVSNGGSAGTDGLMIALVVVVVVAIVAAGIVIARRGNH
ncbi:hypothetical protein JS82_02170 [Methanomassiliicoccaceae archaeon DOK]|nr:hypothetical protein JS82_02170 [Methanomassiliicoccaceae archaeon DOK]